MEISEELRIKKLTIENMKLRAEEDKKMLTEAIRSLSIFMSEVFVKLCSDDTRMDAPDSFNSKTDKMSDLHKKGIIASLEEEDYVSVVIWALFARREKEGE